MSYTDKYRQMYETYSQSFTQEKHLIQVNKNGIRWCTKMLRRKSFHIDIYFVYRYITVYDRRESPLTPDEAEQYHIAKQKMLGNIKFIGKRLFSIQLINHYWILKCSNNCLRKCRGGKLIVYISMSRFLMKISID